MKEQLIHILDQSVCLSRKQMKEYLSGTMLPEETHAAEVHLSSCPLCSLAMEGFSEHSEQALQAIAALNSGFLKDHFDNISPQIHLNSMAPAAGMQMSKSDRKRNNVQPLWRAGSIAAAMLLLFGLVWAFERSHNREANVSMPMAVSGGNGGNGTGGSGNVPENNGTAAATGVASTATGFKPGSESNAGTNSSQSATGIVAAKTGTAGKTTPGASSADRQAGGSIASVNTVSRFGSAPQQDPATAMTMKEPPATKTFIEFDPSAAEQSEKKDPAPAMTSSTVATKSVTNAPEPKAKVPAAALPKTAEDNRDDAERGDDSYSRGSYGTALNLYKKGMNSGDERVRYHSMVMAAQCYVALGNKSKAEELLQRVIDNGPGPDRRAAKRALRRLH